MAKVLIIEDDPLVSRMYQTVFKFEGFDVEMARNGMEGLKKAKDIKPTIVLLDVMMPKMTGIEVLEQMKGDESLKKVPVIMLTNLSGTKDAEAALSKGAVKFIIKSDNKPKQVVAQVKDILKGYTRDEVPEVSGKNSND